MSGTIQFQPAPLRTDHIRAPPEFAPDTVGPRAMTGLVISICEDTPFLDVHVHAVVNSCSWPSDQQSGIISISLGCISWQWSKQGTEY